MESELQRRRQSIMDSERKSNSNADERGHGNAAPIKPVKPINRFFPVM